jgi:PAS domain S-box-containing protein
MCRRIGLPREALVGRNIREFITPNSAAGMADNVRGVLDGRAHVFETTHLSTTGMAFEVEVHESRIMWESRAAILSISRDITERKRVAEEHRQVQALLESAMAQSPAGIIIADAPDVAIRWANPAALSIRGESGLPLTGIEVGRHASRWQTFRPDGRFYPSEDLPLSRAVLKGETTRGEEVVIRHASGEDRWVSVNAAPIRDAAGAVTAGIVVFADITVQKEIEEAERLARTDRELIGRLATAAIQVQDILRFQQEMSRLLGEALDVSRIRVCVYHHDKRTMDSTAEWTAPGVAPKSDGLQGVPPDADLWLMAALMRGEPVRVTDVADIPDGRAVDVMRARGIQSVFVIPLFIGTRFCGYMRLDECRRRREWTAREQSLLAEAVRILMGVWADEDLRCSEERFRGILRNVATVAVQGYSMDGIVRYWNRTSEIFYGYTAEEAMGRNLLDLIIPPAMRDGMRAAMRNMVATGEVIPASELVVMRKDGSSIPVYSSYAIVKIPGRDPELFCIDVDLSDLKRVEMEREKYQTQLAQAQKMESVGRLAGGVAHDFNNMLQAIVGNAELALERMGSNDPLRPVLEEIVKVASRSSDLTRQLLAYARKQAVAPKVLDLNETVADLLKMLRRLIGEDIALNWKPGGALWPVLMDPAQVDAILANLCVNARDAITGTGTITVETGNIVLGADNGFRHTGRLPGDCVWLAVRDDGCGMDAETRSHLFEPFFTTKETGKGTGLGLATVYGVVEQNRGFIDVVSEPGRGTTITIYLPRHVVAAAPVVEECKSQMAGGGETILVVEDEASVLEVTAMTLKSLGYAVLTAATPGEAIRLAREYAGRIDMLLTDVVMPGMNGRDLAETVTSICPGIRRLFMSGYTADVIARQGILDEGVHFIQKPFGKAVLAEKLRKMLARSESGKGGGCLKE